MAETTINHADYVNSIVKAGGSAPLHNIDSPVTRSWRRCINDFRLDPAASQEILVVDQSDLTSRLEKQVGLLSIAQLEMNNLHHQLAGSGFGIILTDADGVVLNVVGDPDFTDTASSAGILAGGVWAEERQGTNGMGTCLIERRPLIIHQDEHFLTRNTVLTCSAAPIFDHTGDLIAVLDASSYSHLAQQHTLVLVNMAAQTIESRVFLCRFKDQYVLRFHSRPEFIGTLGEGEMAFSPEGNLIAVNHSALFQLGCTSHSEIVGKPIHEIFNVSLDAIVERSSRGWVTPIPLNEAKHGNRFFAVLQQPEHTFRPSLSTGMRNSTKRTQTGCHKEISLAKLQLGDTRMARNVRSASRVLGSEIPILIYGETGTGKEIFARAIHNERENKDGRPFIAINCASIPESLIESELFGYKPGAFTGASREGRRGKILEANGGTLFLDEIGDMPLQLQARLLRVLEEREVLPLGSETAVKVNINLISATHRSLPELIEKGEFREDLYYRLQGLPIHLPPLRERQDKRALIRYMLTSESGDQCTAVGIDEDALAALEAYGWPGNIRQLRNVLRTAMALRDGPTITLRDLPEEIVKRDTKSIAPIQDDENLDTRESSLNSLQSAERLALIQGLERNRWNITNLSRQLGLSRNTLYRKMKRLDIQDPEK
jgi:sigma-54 dependent transcriptional regulator, acetoin dehydrogenase operon transcriptional activator AcoR